MKNYTDLEQSKKLAKILPLESADACWTNHMFDSLLSSWRIESTPPQEYKSLLDRFVVRGYLIEPVWSLAALLGVLPYGYSSILTKSFNGKDYYCKIDGKSFESKADNPVDACYEMIIKLHEMNLL